MSSENFGRFFENDSLDYHAKANLSSMLFLSPYITELDSVRGTVDIALTLSGPSSAIIRDGIINVNNSSIHTMLINNPIVNVDGSAVMSNNKLNIKYLNGTSLRKISNKKLESLDNLSVAGSIDFAGFLNQIIIYLLIQLIIEIFL